MNDTVTLKPSSYNDSVAFINTSQAITLGLKKNKQGYISFGTQKLPVKIVFSDKVKENEIFLSKNILSQLYSPHFTQFEIRAKNNEIMIGPYIGILAKPKDHSLTKRYLNRMLNYTREYHKLHGAIVVFALNKINKKHHLIEGYCYNPHTNNWESGLFPYPGSIYCNFPLKKHWQNHLLATIGNTWFNGNFLNKWKMHKILSQNPVIKPHLPDTTLYQSYKDIFNALKKYKKIILKPIGGLQGKNIAQIRVKNKEIIFKYIKKGKLKVIVKNDKKSARHLIKKLFIPGEYILQQYVNLLKYEKSIIDFRIIVQKDQTKNWKCLGIIARMSAPKRIVTNIHNGGKALPITRVLKDYLDLPPYEIQEIQEKLSHLSLEICNTLDQLDFNYGNLGLDIGIDQAGHPWLIEVNNRCPNPGKDQFTNNKALFYQTKSTPLFYAKTLAGF